MAYVRDPRKLRRCDSDEESEEEEGKCSDNDEADMGPTPPKFSRPQEMPGARKKNNIWGELLQDESLADSMKSTVVNAGERVVERGPESFGLSSEEMQNSKRKNWESAKKSALDQEMDGIETKPQMDETADPFEDVHPEDPLPAEDNAKPSTSYSIRRGGGRGRGRGRGRGSSKWVAPGRGGKCGSNNLKRNAPHPTNVLKKIAISPDTSPEAAGCCIARALGEPKTDLMVRVAKVMGVEVATKLYHRAFDQEQKGGLLVKDGSRRRTPGGVMLLYLRDEAKPEQIKEIFEEEREGERKKATANRKKKRLDQFQSELEIMKAKLEEQKKKRAEEDEAKLLKPLPDVKEEFLTEEEARYKRLEAMEAELVPPIGIENLEMPE